MSKTFKKDKLIKNKMHLKSINLKSLAIKSQFENVFLNLFLHFKNKILAKKNGGRFI